MNNKTKFITLAVIFCGLSGIVSAQVSATATATAVIVTPIAITNTADMNFGNVAVSATAGTVILTPAGNRSATGGVTLPLTAGTVSAAAFSVTGSGVYTYAITLPTTDLTLTHTNGVETMIVNTFTSTPTTTGALAAGAETLTVGATLNVNGSQLAGTYVSGTPFTVTVNYN